MAEYDEDNILGIEICLLSKVSTASKLVLQCSVFLPSFCASTETAIFICSPYLLKIYYYETIIFC